MNKSGLLGAFSIVLVYAVISGLWILLSDQAMVAHFKDPENLLNASMAKGWFFVAVTSLLLFWLVRGLILRHQEAYCREIDALRGRQKSLDLLTAIADNSEDAIFAKDLEGCYLLFNRAASRFVGKPADEVLGLDDKSIFPAEQAEILMEVGRRICNSGITETNEEVLDTALGKRTFLATKGALRDAEGKIFGIFGISRDITERKMAEQSLQLLSEDMAATLQAIPDLLFEIDAEGRYLCVKATREALLAAPPDQLIGRTVTEVLPPDASATVMEALLAASQTGADYGRIITLPLPQGSAQFEISIARKPVTSGQGERFVVLSRDITERSVAENQLRQRNAELERFNRATVGRELDMLEMKKTINALSQELGRAPPYPLTFIKNPEKG